MLWFGTSWGSAICQEECEHIATPVGMGCIRCERPIAPGDRGVVTPALLAPDTVSSVAWHLLCLLRAVGIDVE